MPLSISIFVYISVSVTIFSLYFLSLPNFLYLLLYHSDPLCLSQNICVTIYITLCLPLYISLPLLPISIRLRGIYGCLGCFTGRMICYCAFFSLFIFLSLYLSLSIYLSLYMPLYLYLCLYICLCHYFLSIFFIST